MSCRLLLLLIALMGSLGWVGLTDLEERYAMEDRV